MNNENHPSITDMLQKLCESLSREDVTVSQIANQLGTISPERNIGLQNVVVPVNPAFADAQVVSESEESEVPSHLIIKMAPDSGLTLPALETALGPSRAVPRLPRETGPRFIFFVELPDQSYTCAIFATLNQDEGDVTRLIIRRDVRLDE